MEWLALVTWLLVAALALPAAQAPLASLGGQALGALVGVGGILVFAIGGGVAFAWVAVGAACIGIVFAAVGAHTLVEDWPATMRGITARRKESAATLVGFALPFFACAAILSAIVAAVPAATFH
jgi:heme exporter protein D